MKKFHEFLDEKAKEANVADYKGPLAVVPPKNGKYEKTPAAEGAKLPYKGKGEDKGLMSCDTDDKPGFGNEATPNMTPDKNMPHGEKPKDDVKHVKAGGKLKEFHTATSGLNASEFVAYMKENVLVVPDDAVLHGENGEAFKPHPHEVIDYTVAMINNPRLVSRLVSEAGRKGKLGEFVAELLNHPEFVQEVNSQMNEAVAQAIVDDEKTDGKGVLPVPERKPEDVMKKMKKPVQA